MPEVNVGHFESLNYHTVHNACIRGDKARLKQLLGASEVGLLEVKDNSGKTPLIYATIGNHVECVNHLLKSGVLVDNADHNGQTALHWAVYKGHWLCVKSLLEKGALCHKKDLDGVTPLHLAAIHKSSKCLQLILQFGNNYTTYDHWDSAKKTALHWSASVANYDHMKMLLKKDANVNIPDVEGRTPLHWAAACNSPRAVDCVKLLLASSPSALHEAWQDYQGKTALHLAVIIGTNEVVDALTVNDKSQNLQDNMFRTPLHWAALMGLTAKVKMLLDHGPNLSARDANGATPLHYAAHGDHADTVAAFLSQKLAREETDNNGCTPLLWAASRGADKVLYVMQKHGIKLHATDQFSNTALHAASLQGHASTVEWLIQQGCRTDAKNNCGQTPLLLACQVGRAKVLKSLLSKDVSSLHVTDKNGRTALHCAAIGGHALICQMLLQYQADPNVQDYYGLTPLHYASYKGSLNCMSVLIENEATVNCADYLGQTAVHWACLRGKLESVKFLRESGAHLNSLAYNCERCTPLDYALHSGNCSSLLEYLCEQNAVTAATILNAAARVLQKFLRDCSLKRRRKVNETGLHCGSIKATIPDIRWRSRSILPSHSYQHEGIKVTNRIHLDQPLHNEMHSVNKTTSSPNPVVEFKDVSLSKVIYVSHIGIPKAGTQIDILGHCLGCYSEIVIKSPATPKCFKYDTRALPKGMNLRGLAAIVIQRAWRRYFRRKQNLV